MAAEAGKESRSGAQGRSELPNGARAGRSVKWILGFACAWRGPEGRYISRRPSSESSVDLVPFPVFSSKIPVSPSSPSSSLPPASCSPPAQPHCITSLFSTKIGHPGTLFLLATARFFATHASFTSRQQDSPFVKLASAFCPLSFVHSPSRSLSCTSHLLPKRKP